MKMVTALTTVALLWGGVAGAHDFKDAILQAYKAAGFTNVMVSGDGSRFIVTGVVAGKTQSFLVDRKSGVSTPVDQVAMTGKHHHGLDDNGAGRNASDDARQDGAGHDVGDTGGGAGDDAGHDGAGHAAGGSGAGAGDNAGHDGAGHDAGDDHGGSGRDHHGSGDRSGHNQGGHDGASHD